jgi:hypothetical protein
MPSPGAARPQYWLTRLCFQRLLGFIYLMAFLVAANQFKALIGSHGLIPSCEVMGGNSFWQNPTLFHFECSDRAMKAAAWSGVGLSALAASGLADFFVVPIGPVVWFLLWALYLSFANIGGLFWGYGWESLLVEMGFLAIFIGPSGSKRKVPPPEPVIWLLRWLTFRIMFGAGLIKIRGDSCWRDLTCLAYHYETQPIPNPLSWYFHHLPAFFNKASVLFNHFVELVVPFGLFGPRRVRHLAGGFTLLFQLLLILSGNLSFLNYLTICCTIACFDDTLLERLIRFRPSQAHRPVSQFRKIVIYGLCVLIGGLSIKPALNLVSETQIMNGGFDPFRLVNTYGAFGSITRVRHEIVLEGTADEKPGPDSKWLEYQFKCKPGDVSRRPCVVSPYHVRIDWQMWFAAFEDPRYNPWLLRFMEKLLEGDADALGLLETNPFAAKPPRFVRAGYYEYHFAPPDSRDWWVRRRVGEYFPAIRLPAE